MQAMSRIIGPQMHHCQGGGWHADCHPTESEESGLFKAVKVIEIS